MRKVESEDQGGCLGQQNRYVKGKQWPEVMCTFQNPWKDNTECKVQDKLKIRIARPMYQQQPLNCSEDTTLGQMLISEEMM